MLSRKRFPILVVLACVAFAGGRGQAVLADVNPTTGYVQRYVLDDDEEPDYALFETRWWHPDDDGWGIGVYTDNNAVPITCHDLQDSWPQGDYDAADAQDFFDAKWAAYESVVTGAPDPRTNCFSYAFTYSYWIDDLAPIGSNDYQTADLKDADFAIWAGHATKLVIDWEDPEPPCKEYYIKTVSMKDRGSGIFSYGYTFQAQWNRKFSGVPPYDTTSAQVFKQK